MDDGEWQFAEGFLSHLHLERRLSPHTLTNYRRDLQRCATVLAALDRQDWAQVTSHDVRTLVTRLHREGLGGKSIQRLLSALRTLYNWLLREGRTWIAAVSACLTQRTPAVTPTIPSRL